MALIGKAVSEEKMFVIAPAWGHMSPWIKTDFRIIYIQFYYPFPARFSPQMTIPHSNTLATYVDLVVK